MREVDFTPEWYANSLIERAGARVHLGGFVAVIALLVVWSVDSTARSRADVRAVSTLESAMGAQDAMIARIDQINREIDAQQRDIDLLNDLRGGVTAANVMTELSHLMPPSMNLRSLLLDRSSRLPLPVDKLAEGMAKLPERTMLEVTGWAASGEEIGNLVSGMSESPLFTDVSLDYEREETVEQRRVVAFKIECTMPQFE